MKFVTAAGEQELDNAIEAIEAVSSAEVVIAIRPRARAWLVQHALVGIVTAVDVPAPDMEARDILAVPDQVPALTGPLLATAEWIARYYGAPLGLALRAMLPAPLWGQSSLVLKLLERADIGGLAGQLLHWLAERGGEAPVAAAARALKRPGGRCRGAPSRRGSCPCRCGRSA